MKRILSTISLIIFIVIVVLYFLNLNNPNDPISIFYDNKPYKMKAQVSKAQNSNLNFSIYEKIYDGNNSNIKEKILSDSENPILINQDFNPIDYIISNFIDENELSNYKGINVLVNKSNQQIPELSDAANIKATGYVLDLGRYNSEQEALMRWKELQENHPQMQVLTNIIEQIQFQENILYTLKCCGIKDFTMALGLCEKINRNKPDCIITDLGQ